MSAVPVDDLNADDLRDLVGLIEADEGPSASVDPTDLNLPGVWVSLRGLELGGRLQGLTVLADLWLVVPDASPSAQLDDMADLFNRVKSRVRGSGGAVAFDGQVQAVPVVLDVEDSVQTLPGLRVPVRFDTEQP